ncbi:hypothetical protein JH06_1919 [Blastocystis sp. subtype 4]|uniref:hypothetical protein n=1 Tax=Blastocystis sp. subtype 4 TaxID=944170 RepID=UPI000711CDD1|nr:hypothetical protein JH06_1919 [Blastocystis sp. subtype 4]KNB44637.1 hypothetical protein JH06_1919 [Blastocystis sp. subtype 4]|eukprot:XP_014528079.1 hypothetical protein JH06_1919 [Blastocystis sp. subtype 4]
MDLSELVENEIVDLNVDGRRWEGGVLKEDVFGYGRLYDEENRIEYDGWIIEGKKRCYGIEYWSDTGLMKYSGCYFNGLKNGYGILYDLKGNVIYRGYVVTLMITNGFSSANSSLILNYPLMSLKQIEIGNDCFKKVSQFVIDGLSELESVKIGWSSFYLDKSLRRDSKCVIMNCDRLKEIHNLPSLISIQLDESSFYQCNSVIFENLYRLQSITLGYEVFQGDYDTRESNELIMKNLPCLSLIKGDTGSMYNVGKVVLESND